MVPQSTLAMNSPTRSSLPGSMAEKPPKPPSRPRNGCAAASLAKLDLRLATFSLASGCVGEPARLRSDGVGGPEYSCLVIGRGPLACEERRDKLPCEMGYDGRGAAREGRLEPCGDGAGDECGDSSTADSFGKGGICADKERED